MVLRLTVVGLLFITISEQVLEALIGLVGLLMGFVTNGAEVNQFPSIKARKSTKYGDNIEISRKVHLENKVFNILLKEDHQESYIKAYQGETYNKKYDMDSWLDSTIFSENGHLLDSQEKEVMELEHVIPMENIDLDEDVNINPEVQEAFSRDTRMENWCNSTLVLKENGGEGHPLPVQESLNNSGSFFNYIDTEIV